MLEEILIILAPILFLVGWAFNPFNRVKLLRAVMPKRNWIIVQLCKPGGQTSFSVSRGDSPSVVAEKYTFPIKQEAIRYVGSIPLLVFSTEDSNPLYLTPEKKVGEPYRNPEHMTNFLMLIKAFYEAAAERKDKLREIVMWVTLACVVIIVVLSFQTMTAVNNLTVAEAATSAGGALVNRLG